MGALSQERASDAARAPAIEVTRAEQRHLDSLAEFIRRVWDPAATFERVRRARAEAAATNPVEPGRDIPTFLFLHEGRVVGHVSTIPVRVWQASGVRAVHWVKGLEVLPEYQNGPVGFLVLKHAVHELGPALSLAVRPAAHRLLQAVGFRDLGAVPNFLLPLSPARMLERLDLAVLDLPRVPGALRAWRSAPAWQPSRARPRERRPACGRRSRAAHRVASRLTRRRASTPTSVTTCGDACGGRSTRASCATDAIFGGATAGAARIDTGSSRFAIAAGS
ncbi:MAG: GNAT family N-acetyltransferase [Methanobacteriota archaeon]|nr:MAG: GNAT family N-acetyltransferase [Euryarchaeota archaeon]